jgi:hypothetical protein
MTDARFVDHLLFRKLFAPAFSGNLGDEYIVTVGGVFWRKSQEEFLRGLPPMMGSSDPETIAMLEIISDASLPFPATADEVLRWIGRSAEVWTYIPDWLKASLLKDSAELASASVREARPDLEVRTEEARREERWMDVDNLERELKELDAAADAFSSLANVQFRGGEAACPVIVPTLPQARRIGKLLEAALEGLELPIADATHPPIIAWLRHIAVTEAGKGLGLKLEHDRLMYYDEVNGNTDITAKRIREAIRNRINAAKRSASRRAGRA